MARFYFEVEDEEMIQFLKKLKRKRSAVIVKLIYRLMEESDEFLPGWLMAETNCFAQVGTGKPKPVKQVTYVEEVREEVKPKDDNASVALAGLSGFGL